MTASSFAFLSAPGIVININNAALGGGVWCYRFAFCDVSSAQITGVSSTVGNGIAASEFGYVSATGASVNQFGNLVNCNGVGFVSNVYQPVSYGASRTATTGSCSSSNGGYIAPYP